MSLNDLLHLVCSHVWIDPEEAPIHRAPYSPVVGPGRREMKPGRRYACQRCGRTIEMPADLRVPGLEEERS